MTTYYVGTYVEWTGNTSTMVKDYGAGGQRVAMRKGSSTVSFLLGAPLGCTSVTANSNGTLYTSLRDTPWGETRYTAGATPTTGQYTLRQTQG